MPDRLKLALLGCGAISHFHIDGIKNGAPRIDITAAIDTDPGKADEIAAKTGAAAYNSLDEALEKADIDAVDVMLPHDLHEWAAIRLFEEGKHVLLEKPIAPDLESCERIFAAAEKSDTVFMVAENSQYWPEIVETKRIIEDGVIGDITTARAAFVVEFDDYWFGGKNPWRYDRKRTGGGIAIDGGAHWIRPLRMWMGEISQVIAAFDYPLEQMQGESLARALIRFESGRIAVFDAMMLDAVLAPDQWWRITGTKGEITIENSLGGGEGGVMVFDENNRNGKLVMKQRGYPASFIGEFADFCKVILDGKTPDAGPEVSLGELRTALAMYRSAESNRWENVWE